MTVFSYTALRQLGQMFLAIFFFHTSEYFLAITIHGKSKVTLNSLLISKNYILAMVFSLLEYIVEIALFPALKEYWWVSNIGLLMVIVGEIIRKLAIITAGQSFTHLIKIYYEEHHKLITHGVYRFVRHPGYTGFLIWAVGTQIMLCNPLSTIAFAVIVWGFFAERIPYEEYFLRQFFGQQYDEYARRIPSGIPLVQTFWKKIRNPNPNYTMTSKKKQSEGIALLSMYNDEEEEDEEMEDADEQPHDQSQHDEEHFRESSEAVAFDEDSAAAPMSEENIEEMQQIEETKNSVGDNEGVENREGSGGGGGDGGGDGENSNPLDKFLPPPPKEPCSEDIQKRIERFIELKKKGGRSFNAEVRKKKAYRNPDFLLHAVRYQEIDQIGSCFDKSIFDPHGYDKSDFFDEIEADMRRERERKDQELKKSPKVEFVPGGIQPGVVVPSSKFSLPIPPVNPVPSTADPIAREGRQNKKSKWDKVDDGRIPLAAGGQDPLATAAAHAASLSAANAGAGYSAFVQQKRREAEEKKSSERKLERRS